jgi:hypothetical protein
VNSDDLLKHLESVSGKVENLTEKLDIVVNYWVKMEMTLENMHKHANDLKNIEIWQLRARELRKDWRETKENYSEYTMEVRYSSVAKFKFIYLFGQLLKLQDRYPVCKKIS